MFPSGLANIHSETAMENAPGTYEKSKNKSEMQCNTDDYCIQMPNEPR